MKKGLTASPQVVHDIVDFVASLSKKKKKEERKENKKINSSSTHCKTH